MGIKPPATIPLTKKSLLLHQQNYVELDFGLFPPIRLALFIMGAKHSSKEVPLPDATDERYYGLENFGNTCYANAVIQALYACTPFRSKIIEFHETSSKKKEARTLLTCLAKLYHKITTSKKPTGVMGPVKLINTLKRINSQFQGETHQDAQEFLNFLLNDISDSLKKRTGKESSFVEDIFQGKLSNETKCMRCEGITRREETFLDLSLDIEDNTSLTHCLRLFSAHEVLDGQDKYYCEKCHWRQEATKCMRIQELPEVAVCHLKRFKYVESANAFTKLCYRVVFPMELKLVNTSAEAVNADRAYHLFAVVAHIGAGTRSGHYVCLSKNQTNWLLFDDENIHLVQPEDVAACFGSLYSKGRQDGYLLFYQSEMPCGQRTTKV